MNNESTRAYPLYWSGDGNMYFLRLVYLAILEVEGWDVIIFMKPACKEQLRQR